MVAAGFADTKLGPRIVGPQGDEVTGELVREGQKIADIVSYVACPAPKDGEVAAEECGQSPEKTALALEHQQQVAQRTEHQPGQ